MFSWFGNFDVPGLSDFWLEKNENAISELLLRRPLSKQVFLVLNGDSSLYTVFHKRLHFEAM